MIYGIPHFVLGLNHIIAYTVDYSVGYKFKKMAGMSVGATVSSLISIVYR